MDQAFFRTALTAVETPLSSGEVVNERFKIVEKIGSGDMSIVYKAEDIQLDRICALKVLHPHLLIDPESAQRFQREAIAAAALDHPNIAKVFGSGVWDGKPYVASEFVEGTTFAAFLSEHGRMSIEEAVPIFAQILDALIHAHEHGILHRDLKPSNVILSCDGQKAKIVDFGMAKILPESGKQLQTITHTGQLMGTLAYMSPEQCMGFRATERSDIYSMGCLMYETLVGDRAFYGASDIAIIARHMKENPKNSDYLANDIGKVVLRALNKDAEKRPASATELKEAILHPTAVNVPLVRVQSMVAGAGAVAGAMTAPLAKVQNIVSGEVVLRTCLVAAALSTTVMAGAFLAFQYTARSAAHPSPKSQIDVSISAHDPIRVDARGHHLFESDAALQQQLDRAETALQRGDYDTAERWAQAYHGHWTEGPSPIHMRLMNTAAEVACRRGQWTLAGQRYRKIEHTYALGGPEYERLQLDARLRAERCLELGRAEANKKVGEDAKDLAR